MYCEAPGSMKKAIEKIHINSPFIKLFSDAKWDSSNFSVMSENIATCYSKFSHAYLGFSKSHMWFIYAKYVNRVCLCSKDCIVIMVLYL